jgi:hypothetical protein
LISWDRRRRLHDFGGDSRVLRGRLVLLVLILSWLTKTQSSQFNLQTIHIASNVVPKTDESFEIPSNVGLASLGGSSSKNLGVQLVGKGEILFELFSGWKLGSEECFLDFGVVGTVILMEYFVIVDNVEPMVSKRSYFSKSYVRPCASAAASLKFGWLRHCVCGRRKVDKNVLVQRKPDEEGVSGRVAVLGRRNLPQRRVDQFLWEVSMVQRGLAEGRLRGRPRGWLRRHLVDVLMLGKKEKSPRSR